MNLASTSRRNILFIILGVLSFVLLLLVSINYLQSVDTKPTPQKPESNVVEVIDGDTIIVEKDQTEQTIRLIGIDTPELSECFGKEARAKAKEILNGKIVRLKADETQANKDIYDRLLRYIILPDGTNLNLELTKLGYAREYTFEAPYKYQTEFKQAQQSAKGNKLGLWSDDTCS